MLQFIPFRMGIKRALPRVLLTRGLGTSCTLDFLASVCSLFLRPRATPLSLSCQSRFPLREMEEKDEETIRDFVRITITIRFRSRCLWSGGEDHNTERLGERLGVRRSRR